MLASRIASIFRFAGLLGMILMVGSFAVLIVIPRGDSRDQRSLRIGDEKTFTVRGKPGALGGLARVTVARAEIKLADDSWEAVPVTALTDDAWGDEISTRVTTYRGAQVSDGVSAPKLELRVALPKDDARWLDRLGQTFMLRLTGEYEYPRQAGESAYEVEAERFSVIESIRIVGPGLKKRAEDWAVIIPAASFGAGFLMMMLGWPVAFVAWKIAIRADKSPTPLTLDGVGS